MLGGPMSFETVLELLLVDGWLVKRLPTAPVWQDQASDAAHVVFHHLRSPLIGRQSKRSPVHGDVGAHAVNVKVHADASNQAQQGIVELYCWEPVPRREEAGALSLFGVSPLCHAPLGVAIKGNAPPHHFSTYLDIALSLHVHRQTKTVQQLGPQFSFLRIHRADQDKGGWMARRDAFALNIIHPHSGGIEQDIDKVVAEQIDFVNIQQTTVRGCQQARLKMFFTALQGPLDIQGPHDPILSSPEWQLDECRRSGHGLPRYCTDRTVRTDFRVI